MSGSPQLIAGCHVLLRLLMPRHPPCALFSLNSTTEFLPSGSLFWFLSLNYLSLANNCFGCISLSPVKRLSCALLTIAIFMTKLCFLPSTNKKTFVFSLISIICSFYSFLIRFSMNTISFQSPLSDWWAQVDSNHRPRAYQARALTT